MDSFSPTILSYSFIYYKSFHIPLDRIIAAFLCYIHHRIVIVPIWGAEQGHLIACEFLHFGMYLHQLLLFLLIGKLAHILVVLAVVSQIMPWLSCGNDTSSLCPLKKAINIFLYLHRLTLIHISEPTRKAEIA